MAIQFPQRWTTSTPAEKAPAVLQNAIDFLADLFDKFQNKQVKGTAVITNANLTVDVTFPTSLSSPAVVVSPLADPGGRFWISNRTSAGFRINQSVAAPIAGVGYDWIGKGV